MTKKSMVLLRVMSRAAGIFLCLGMVVLLVNAAHAQSFWEKRQKRVEEMRKKDLKKPPQDKMIVTPETKPVPEEEIQEPIPAEEFTLPPLEMFEPEETLGLKEVPSILRQNDFVNPKKITISDEYGTIKEVFYAGQNKKTIIHVQDAHMNYDAQMSIAHIVEDLLTTYGINVVMIEGGYNKEAGVGALKYRSTRESKIEILKQKLKEGLYDGVEYLDAISTYPLDVRGLEKKEVFFAGDPLHLEILNLKGDAKKMIKKILVANHNLKAGIFSKRLLNFDSKRKEYNEEKITLTEYSLYLKNNAKDINIRKKAPNFDKLLQTINLEQEIDFPGVDDERTKLIDEITKKADKEKSDEIVQKSLDFRQGNINAVEYYAYLKNQHKGELSEDYPNLEKYINYISIHKDVDTHLLFAEIDQVEWDIRKQYYENSNQKKLDLIDRNLKILEGLFDLALTPDEYVYYQENRREFRKVKEWIHDLNKLAQKLNLATRFDINVSIVEDKIPVIDRFYANTYERDEAFMTRADETFKETKKNVLIMVTGGFHTPNLVRLFNEGGYSYMVIAPKIENPTPPGLYDKVIREDIKSREK